MIFYALKDTATNLYWDGTYWGKDWSEKPRLFRSLSGLRNSLDADPQSLNYEWNKSFCETNTEPPLRNEDGKWSQEHNVWAGKRMGEWWEFKRKSRGISFLDKERYALIEVGVLDD